MFRIAMTTAAVVLATGTVRADEKVEIRKEVERQIELIKKGDADELKKHFTERQRERVTADAVKAAKKTADGAKADELVDSVTTDKDKDGRKTVKVKTKAGRTLTTFVEVDGKWLADTIWFK